MARSDPQWHRAVLSISCFPPFVSTLRGWCLSVSTAFARPAWPWILTLHKDAATCDRAGHQRRAGLIGERHATMLAPVGPRGTRERQARAMSLFAFCIAGTALSYLMGLRTPGRGYGTVAGWATSLAIGVFLGLLYYVYSAYGLCSRSTPCSKPAFAR